MKKILLSGVCTFFCASSLFASGTTNLSKDEALDNLQRAVAKLIVEQEKIQIAIADLKIDSPKKTYSSIEQKQVPALINNSNYVITIAGSVNVREVPSKNGPRKALLHEGHMFSGTVVDNGWIYIKDEGYVQDLYAKRLSSFNTSNAVLAMDKNIRTTPMINKDNIVGLKTKGSSVEIYEHAFNKFWYLTKDGNFIYKPRN